MYYPSSNGSSGGFYPSLTMTGGVAAAAAAAATAVGGMNTNPNATTKDTPIGELNEDRKFFLANMAFTFTSQDMKKWFGVSSFFILFLVRYCYLYTRKCNTIAHLSFRK